jgi:UDP-N-acetylglucosamine enolpyruvyl transferase
MLKITRCDPEHLRAVITKLGEAGVEIDELNQSTLRVGSLRTALLRAIIDDRAAPAVSDRYAGAIYGADDAGAGDSLIKENDL